MKRDRDALDERAARSPRALLLAMLGAAAASTGVQAHKHHHHNYRQRYRKRCRQHCKDDKKTCDRGCDILDGDSQDFCKQGARWHCHNAGATAEAGGGSVRRRLWDRVRGIEG